MYYEKIEVHDELEKMRKVRQMYGEVFRYFEAPSRAEYNTASDLSTALSVHQSKHFPFLTAKEIPDLFKGLNAYSGRIQVVPATKLLMLTGVRTTEPRVAEWKEFNLDEAL